MLKKLGFNKSELLQRSGRVIWGKLKSIPKKKDVPVVEVMRNIGKMPAKPLK